MNSDKTLSTADLARAGKEAKDPRPDTTDKDPRPDTTDLRGRRDEEVRAHDAVLDRPEDLAARTRDSRTPPDDQRATPLRPATSAPVSSAASPLFGEKDAADLRTRWSDIQTGFVDEPRKAVERADALVADVMKRLAEVFASERSGLEKQWDRGDAVTTEDLRVALQRYRTFFDRLLAV